ncbi:MAG: hypothetical protein V1839_01330 [archaeon]
MAKAQVGIETLFSALVLLLILSFSVVYAFSEKGNNEIIENSLDVQSNCWKLSNFISETFVSGDGTTVKTNFIKSYSFWVFPSSRFISATSDLTSVTVFCTLPVSRVSNATGTIPKSFLLANKTAMTLTNIGDLVVVT